MGDGMIGAVGGLRLGRFARWYNAEAFRSEGASFAGISGGETSGMMAALLSPKTVLTFQNTGREHPRTYDFLNELDGALGGRVRWLEFRKPKVKGTRPRDFEFAVVDYKTADRSGGPLAAFMEAMTEYRAAKGEPPIEPWARQRLCTGYTKHKVADHYIESLGVTDCDRFIGLRYDEQGRIEEMHKASTRRRRFRFPLNLAEIISAGVAEFWDMQTFRLGLAPEDGNCTACFLKDQTDLSRVLAKPETDAPWWFAMQDRYPGFGGRTRPTYRQLASECDDRLAIERVLRAGKVPQNASTSMDDRRFRLVVIQERKRIEGKVERFSCACESSFDLADKIDAADDAEGYRDPWETPWFAPEPVEVTTRRPRPAPAPKETDPLTYDTDFEVSLSLCCGHDGCAERVTVDVNDGNLTWAKTRVKFDARDAGWHVEDVALCPTHRRQLPLFA